jgi:hypothetical protein
MVIGRSVTTMVAGKIIAMTKEIFVEITLIAEMTGATYAAISERLRTIVGRYAVICATETMRQLDGSERSWGTSIVTYIATAAIFGTTDGIPGTTAAIFDGIVVTGVKSRLVEGRQREALPFCFCLFQTAREESSAG